ncbi:unnamed protein product [Caenorhabditis auriculariae]|uniref:Uncharacterized protein n=1 Tax=Caenorhabditis auriculariae TaxID=2777116 RepID=A0A8S1HAM8_9PELO|nr:unnamed protein product [Caenorhabditis auriculariae]
MVAHHEDTKTILVTWLFIFAVIMMIITCLCLRLIFQTMIDRNFCNLRTIMANSRIFQSKVERKECQKLANLLDSAFKGQNINRIAPLQPRFVCATMSTAGIIEMDEPFKTQTSNAIHWPLFHVAIDGKIAEHGALVASDVPKYDTLPGIPCQHTCQPEMLTTEVLRNAIQPLSVNTSLNSRNDSPNGCGSSFSSYHNMSMSSPVNHVPYDRPLFVNTSMSAQQRIELYSQLAEKPRDDQPALTFRFNY